MSENLSLTLTCANCGFHAKQLTISKENLSIPCPQCGLELGEEAIAYYQTQPSLPEAQTHSEPRQLKFEFKGTSSEFFRIWMVNISLTILTLGIYNAWAKVRTRQYFYGNTYLDGHSFDYLAQPKAILMGNIVIGLGSLGYFLSQYFSAVWVTYLLMGIFGLIWPWLVYKSLRFRAHNSSYRNVRFRFTGSLGESYTAYFWRYLLVPISLGFALPHVMYKQKEYFFDNFRYGKSRNLFQGYSNDFFKIYLKAYGIAIGLGILASVGFGFLGGASLLGNMTSQDQAGPRFYIFLGILYLGMIAVSLFTQQFIKARTNNYCWNNTTVGPDEVKFVSNLRSRDLAFIQISNILAIIASLGLLTPWARIRHARYVLDRLEVHTTGNFESFFAPDAQTADALGEVATEFFDFEVAL